MPAAFAQGCFGPEVSQEFDSRSCIVVENDGDDVVAVRFVFDAEHLPIDACRARDLATLAQIEQVAGAFGISVSFDDSVPVRQVRFRVDNVQFAPASAGT